MKRLNIIRAAVLIAAIVFICIGLKNGEAGVVMRKAMQVCLECIGVG